MTQNVFCKERIGSFVQKLSNRNLIFLIILANPLISLCLDNTKIYYFYILGPVLALLLLLQAQKDKVIWIASLCTCAAAALSALLALFGPFEIGKIHNHFFSYIDTILLLLFMSAESNVIYVFEAAKRHVKAMEVAVVIINIVELFLLATGNGYEYRFTWGGTFFHGTNTMPHTLSYLMLVALIFVSLIIMIEKNRLYAVFAIVPLLAVFKSGARSTLILCAFFILLLIDQLFTKKQKSLLIKALVVIGIGLVGLILFWDKIQSSALWSKMMLRAESGNQSAGRLYMWQDLLDKYLHNSNFLQYLFGQGDDKSYYYNGINPLILSPVWGHNDFVQILLGKGLFGLFLYGYALIKCGTNIIRKNRNIYKYPLLALVLAAAVINGFYSYRDISLCIPFLVVLAVYYGSDEDFLMENELNDLLEREAAGYRNSFSRRDWIIAAVTNDPQYTLWRYHKYMRRAEYYYNRYKNAKSRLSSLFYAGLFMCWKWRRNRLGNRISVDIRENSFGEGLIIYHNNIVVNGHASIGKNCRLHGNNVIGNDGKTADTPVIGDNVDIGAGAIIIGNVKLADNIKVGAGAVVTKSFPKAGKTIAGVPAREV